MIDLNILKENVLKAEGYAQGFKDGYISCAKYVTDSLSEDNKNKSVPSAEVPNA